VYLITVGRTKRRTEMWMLCVCANFPQVSVVRLKIQTITEESGFNLQRYLSLRYNNGWIWLSCVTGSSTAVVSMFILPPLSLKETQESAWSQRLTDWNFNKGRQKIGLFLSFCIISGLRNILQPWTNDILLLVNDFHHYCHLPPHSRRSSSRQFLETFGNL